MGKERKRRKKKRTNAPKESGIDEFHEADDDMDQRKTKSTSNYSVKDLLEKVDECTDSFNFEVAQKFCERALEMEPDNVKVLETAGAVCLELGETDKAVTYFRHSINIAPDCGHSKYMYLGQLLQGKDAVESFRKGIEIMITRKEQSACNGAAKETAEEVTSADISSAYCALAEVYLTDNCFEEDAGQQCQDCCQKAIEQDPTNPEAYQLKASCLLSQENIEEAKVVLKKSLELWQGKEEEPAQALAPPYESRITAVKLLLELDEHEAAGGVLDGLLEENDDVPQVWYLMGWMHYLIGEDTGTARFALEKANKLFVVTECDDQPMLEHINELLASLPEGDQDDEEDMSEGSGDEEMDVQEEDA